MSESSPPYVIVRPFASAAQIALAKRYSTLADAFPDIAPGCVVRDSTGAIVAFHESVERFAVYELSKQCA